MSTQVQYRRGTDTQNDAFTGAIGEITVDTTNKTLRVHDGATQGGSNIATVAYVDNQIGNIEANAITFGNTSMNIASSNANIVANVAGTTILTIHSDGIDNNLSDGVGNIGNATTAFNTVFAKATSAQYADLAEKYESDAEYKSGTVIAIGGEKEVTQSVGYANSSVVGVVSTNPAHIMNSNIRADISIDLALTGRAPCQVVGNINKGDVLTSSEIPGVAARLEPESFVPGCILGKALENYSGTSVGIIEVLVGKA